jgi:hypothetical protein
MLNCIVLEHGRSCFESYFAFYLLLQMLFTLEGSGWRVKKEPTNSASCKILAASPANLLYLGGSIWFTFKVLRFVSMS